MDARYEPYLKLSDLDIVERILADETDILPYLLIARCGSGLKYLIHHKYRSLHLEFNEFVSEICLVLMKNNWKALRDFKGQNTSGRPCKIETYIISIASRWLWKKMEKSVQEIDWLLPLYEQELWKVPDKKPDRARLAMEVIDAIQALPNPIERQAIIQYKIEGRSVHDVADALNTSPANIYTICSRALKNLRALFDEGGIHA